MPPVTQGHDTGRPVSARRIAIAAEHLENAAELAIAVRRAGVSYALGCAVIEGESGGANIYGHDVGGALSTKGRSVTVCGKTYPPESSIPVTPENAGIFLIMIGAGAKSNGMGPAQLTYAGELPDGRSGGEFRLALEEGYLPWVPVDNMAYCLGRMLKPLIERYGDREGLARYNGGNDLEPRHWQYADRALARLNTWQARFKR